MDKVKVKAIREDIQQALKQIEEKYQVQLVRAGASYDISSVKYSIELVETNGRQNNPYLLYENEFNRTFHFNLELGDECSIRTRNGNKVAKLIGMKPNARKAPYVVECEGQLYRVELEKFNKV